MAETNSQNLCRSFVQVLFASSSLKHFKLLDIFQMEDNREVMICFITKKYKKVGLGYRQLKHLNKG